MFEQSVNLDEQISCKKYLRLINQRLLELIPKNLINLQLTPDYLNKYFFGKSQKNLRSNILLSFLTNSTSSNNQIPEEQFIVTYCVILELLNIATNIHSLIADKHNNILSIANISISLEQAILIGDLIFTIAFEKMASLDNIKILEFFSSATQQMALYEAKISEFMSSHETQIANLEINSDNNIELLIELIEQKYSPLYNAITFFLNNFNVNLTKIDTIFIGNLNKINILNKLIKKNIYTNEIFSALLYSQQNLDKISLKLSRLITEQKAIANKYYSSNSQLLHLISLTDG
jgi:hypothetical protein